MPISFLPLFLGGVNYQRILHYRRKVINPLYIGLVYLSVKGCWVNFVAFILFVMENPVSKQCNPCQIRYHIM